MLKVLKGFYLVKSVGEILEYFNEMSENIAHQIPMRMINLRPNMSFPRLAAFLIEWDNNADRHVGRILFCYRTDAKRLVYPTTNKRRVDKKCEEISNVSSLFIPDFEAARAFLLIETRRPRLTWGHLILEELERTKRYLETVTSWPILMFRVPSVNSDIKHHVIVTRDEARSLIYYGKGKRMTYFKVTDSVTGRITGGSVFPFSSNMDEEYTEYPPD